jgi:hypothetical protein
MGNLAGDTKIDDLPFREASPFAAGSFIYN